MFRFLKATILAALLAAAALAQTTTAPVFSVRATTTDSAVDLPAEGNLNMPTTGIGANYSATLVATNRSTSNVTLNFLSTSGSNDFVITGFPETPLSVPPNGVFGFNVVYTATTSARVSSRVSLNYTLGGVTSNFNLGFTGLAPEFVYSYIVSGGNSTPIASGGTIAYPQTNVLTPVAATVVLTNRGSAQGIFKSATLTGDAAFTSSNVPLADTLVDAGKDMRFTVNFTPTVLDSARGSLAVVTGDKSASFALQGSGLGATWAYEATIDRTVRPLAPNQTLPVPDAVIGGDKTSVTVRFRNTGNADGKVSAISVAGTGFTLSEVPILPLTVIVGQTVAFTVNFQPTATGRAQGRLRIGNDDFELVSNGLGATLTYAFVINNVSTSVADRKSVV